MNIISFTFLHVMMVSVQTVYSLLPSHYSNKDPLNGMRHLDLIWSIREEIESCDVTKEICGNVCVECEGGRTICRFCGGTGFFMVGDDLIGTNNDCPVCEGHGEEECKNCMGSGRIVDWRKDYKLKNT